MCKPKKLTEGLSSGPQAYWDSISDVKKDAEIERLRELVGFAYSEGFFKAGRPLAEGDLGRISTFSLSAWYKEEWKKSETKQMLENEVSDGGSSYTRSLQPS